MNAMRGRMLIVVVMLLVVLLPLGPASAGCIVGVTCPWYVTAIYWWGVDLVLQGYTPIQIVQIAYQNIGWIQAQLGISEAEAVYAIAEAYATLEPWYAQVHSMLPPGGGAEGGYSGDEPN